MAWLLFLDESGHDHRQMPYEARSGVALQDARLWSFTLAVQQLEQVAFGCALSALMDGTEKIADRKWERHDYSTPSKEWVHFVVPKGPEMQIEETPCQK